MKKILIIFAGLLITLSALTGLFMSSRPKNYNVNLTIKNILGDLQELNDKLKIDILMLHGLNLNTYESLNMHLNDFSSVSSRLKKILKIHPDLNEDFVARLSTIRNDVKEIIEQCEDFKTNHALIENSIKTLSSSSDFIANLQQDDPAIGKLIENIRNDVFHFLVNDRQKSKPFSPTAIPDLRKLGENAPVKIRDTIEYFIEHVEKVILKNSELKKNLSLIKSSQFDNDVQLAIDEVNLNLVTSEQQASIFRWLLYLSCLILLTAIVFALFQLRQTAKALASLNKNLDNKVREKTSELIHSNSINQAILDSANYSIISTEVNGIIRTFNTAAEKMLRYDAEELIGKQTPAIIHDSYEVVKRAKELSQELGKKIDPGFEVFVANARAGKVDEREWTYIRKDGTRFPVKLSVTAIRNENNEINSFLGIASDLTEQKKIDSIQARLASIVATSDDAIMSKTLDGIITSWNPAAEKLFGYSEREMLGQSIQRLLPLDRISEESVFMKKINNGERIEHFETVRLKKNGQEVAVSISLAPLLDKSGEITGVSKIVRDITERKRIEKLKNEFVSTVSHELRTPLTSIRGALGLIKGGKSGEVPEKAKPLIDIALNNCERLVRLINDILDIEKIESGKMDFHFKLIPIVGILNQSVKSNESYGLQFQVGYQLNIAPDLTNISVLIDQDRFTQVVTNLLSNATKFSPKGSEVLIKAYLKNDKCRIEISDKGPGIPEEFKNKIFQKFAQADSSDTRQKGGTGLGLNISKVIIERMQGQIGFESTSGQGTTFFFELPLAKIGTITAADLNSSIISEKKKILVCEDDTDVATILTSILNNHGYEATIANSGKATLDALQTGYYNGVTLDLVLPDGDGIDLLRKIRTMKNCEHLPVVVVSAKANLAKKEISGDILEVIDWIEKPIDENRLVFALKNAISMIGDHRPHILHIEDDEDTLNIISEILSGIADVDKAQSIEEAGKKLDTKQYDLVILDMQLTDGNGSALLYERKVTGKAMPPVVIFSAQKASPEIQRMVAMTLLKSTTSNEAFITAIKSALDKNRKTKKNVI